MTHFGKWVWCRDHRQLEEVSAQKMYDAGMQRPSQGPGVDVL